MIKRLQTLTPPALLTMLFIAGCTTPVTPPGATLEDGKLSFKKGTVPLPEVQYATLRWYSDSYDSEYSSTVEKTEKQLAEKLFRMKMEDLVKNLSPLLSVTSDGTPVINREALSTNLVTAKLKETLVQLNESLKNKFSLQLSETETPDLIPWGTGREAGRRKNAFANWLQKQSGTLDLPDPESFNRIQFATNIRDILTAVSLKLDFEDEFSSLASLPPQKARELLSFLETRTKDLRFVETICQSDALTEKLKEKQRHYADQFIRLKLSEFLAGTIVPLKKMNEEVIKNEADLDMFNQALRAAENNLYQLLSETLLKDDWLRDSLEKRTGSHAALLVENMRLFRKFHLQEYIRKTAENRNFPECLRFIRNIQSQLQQFETSPFVLYSFSDNTFSSLSSSKSTFIAAVNDAYATTLPSAYNFYLEAARKEITNNTRYGLGIAVCELLRKLESPLPASHPVSDSVILYRKKAAKLESESSDFFRNASMRKLIIHPFSSAINGKGTTITNDLIALMKTMEKNHPHLLFTVVSELPVPGTRDLTVAKGHIANFNADDVTELRKNLFRTRWTEPETIPNPDYNQHTSSSRRASLPAHIYHQYKMRIAIEQINLERVGHIRINFEIQSGNESRFFEVNEFIRETSVQQQVSLEGEKRIDTFTTTDPKNKKEVKAYEALKNQRLITASEMLEKARLQTLDLLTGRIILELEHYPVNLYQKAEDAAESSSAEAADYFGYCLELIRHMPIHEKLTATTDEKGYRTKAEEELKKEKQALNKTLEEIKESAGKNSVEQVKAWLHQ